MRKKIWRTIKYKIFRIPENEMAPRWLIWIRFILFPIHTIRYWPDADSKYEFWNWVKWEGYKRNEVMRVTNVKRYEGKRKENLLSIIESFRKKDHYYVDEDGWYSCPAHKDYCGEDEQICRCGFAEHNAKVDEALQLLRSITN